jgi:plasmid stabilization system protein ParE
MKVLDIPKSGKCRDVVFYRVRGLQYWRRHVVPRNPRTAAQRRAREILSAVSKAWSELLTERERRAWMVAGRKVSSHPRLGQSGPLTGEMYFAGINSARLAIGRALLREPPERIVFSRNPVAELTISQVQGRLKLELRVSGPVTEDIMVLGAAPCSAGRRKCRKPAYLGLLPAPVGGMSDITEMYVRRYGEPKAGERVFIRTRQQRDGWEDWDKDVSEIVPARPLVVPARGVEIRRPKPENRRKSEIRDPNTVWAGGRLLAPGRLLHESCPRELRRSGCLVTRLQFPCNRRCARGVGGVGRPWGVCALGEGDRNGPWHELWHHS